LGIGLDNDAFRWSVSAVYPIQREFLTIPSFPIWRDKPDTHGQLTEIYECPFTGAGSFCSSIRNSVQKKSEDSQEDGANRLPGGSFVLYTVIPNPGQDFTHNCLLTVLFILAAVCIFFGMIAAWHGFQPSRLRFIGLGLLLLILG